jgi:hypothetical protein
MVKPIESKIILRFSDDLASFNNLRSLKDLSAPADPELDLSSANSMTENIKTNRSNMLNLSLRYCFIPKPTINIRINNILIHLLILRIASSIKNAVKTTFKVSIDYKVPLPS